MAITKSKALNVDYFSYMKAFFNLMKPRVMSLVIFTCAVGLLIAPTKIEFTNIPEFPITGKYLLEKGLKSGRMIGEILKKVEKEWIENDFNLKEEELKNLINKNT